MVDRPAMECSYWVAKRLGGKHPVAMEWAAGQRWVEMAQWVATAQWVAMAQWVATALWVATARVGRVTLGRDAPPPGLAAPPLGLRLRRR